MNEQEKILRSHVRQAILLSEIKKRKKIAKVLEEESLLRSMLRKIIMEVATDSEDDPHPKTGINFLRDLFKDTNVLKSLRAAYKSLTSNGEQRKSFRAHVLTWIVDTLAPLEATEMAGPPVHGKEMGTLEPLSESLNIDVVTDADREKSLMDELPSLGDDDDPDVPATEEEEESEEDLNKFKQLEGADTTGRNVAKRIYKVIEKSVVQYYNQIGRDDVEDRELFRDYLLANIKLYFNKWENELQPSVEEPTNDEYEQSKDNVQTAATGDPLAGSSPANTDVEGPSIPDLETREREAAE